MPVGQNQTVRFGPFELDTRCAELRKSGIRLKLQGQPIQILEMLVAHPGELVTREEIQQRLWPADTFVDFDHSLNTAIKKLRQALGDEADAPRYIETLPKRGYRFIGEVEKEAPREENPIPADTVVVPLEPVVTLPTNGRARRKWVLAGCLATLFIASWLLYQGSTPPSLPRITGSHSLVTNIHTTLPLPEIKLLTDGTSIYYQTSAISHVDNPLSIFQVPVAGGAASEIPVVDGFLYDISRDGSELFFMEPASSADHASILAKPLPAGSARLILKDGRYPIWVSDGRGIFFVRNDDKELDRADADGTGVQRIATSTDVIYAPHLSPDGSRIRFSSGKYGPLWEVGTDGSSLHPILADQELAFGGAWSPDGKVYFFTGWDGERFSLWTAPDRRSWWQRSPAIAQQLTSGPNSYGRPAISRDGKQLFAMGEEHQGELSVYDRK
jgi:DNA-binding winged helix-turn-helix (wHTH) protein/Tol biopolymer transport system component